MKYVFLVLMVAVVAASCSQNTTGKLPTSDNEYVFTLKNKSFNNDTPIDGVKVLQLGKYLYALQGWNPNFLPKVKPYVFKWSVDDLGAAPVREDGPWNGRHQTPSFVLGDTICIAGSDVQLEQRQQDAWIAYANDTGKLTWMQTTPYCEGCNQPFMGGALNPADQCYYYGGGQLTFDFTDGLVDTLWKTCDFFRTSEYVGRFEPLGGNILGTLKFFGDNQLHIICGGLYHRTKPPLRVYKKSHYVIDVKEKTVTQLEDFPGDAVMYPSIAVADNKLFFYGGANGGNNSGLYVYDTTGTWTVITNSTLPETHAAGFAGYTDTKGNWHLAKIAGNFTNDVYQVDFPKKEQVNDTAVNN